MSDNVQFNRWWAILWSEMSGKTKKVIHPTSYRVSKKNALLWFCLICLVRNILEAWSIFHLKGGIYRSIWSTKTFLYDIREPRYKRNNMEYHISKFLNIKQSCVLKTETQNCFLYISVLPCCAELGLNLKNAYGCYL